MTRVDRLAQELTAKAKDIRALLDDADERAGGENLGVLTGDEQTRYETLSAEYRDIKKQLKAAKEQAALLKEMDDDELATDGRQTRAGATTTTTIRPIDAHPERMGFRDVREQLGCIVEHARTGQLDPRLEALAAGSDEQSGANNAYGGFLIAPAFRPDLLMVGAESDPSAGLVQDIPMDSSIVSIPARVDKDHSSSVSGGTTVTRRPETVAATSSRAEFEQVKLEATGVFGLTYVSEELLRRSAISITALLQRGFQDEFQSHMLNEKMTGTGNGEFEGINNAPCLIAVAKESGQAADTINGTNIIKMRARVWNYARSIWLANHDCYVQLASAHIAGTNGDVFLLAPGNGVDVPDTLLGRPIYFTEYSQTLGDQGDLSCWVPSEYLVGTEVDGPQQAESMHVRFENHERTFKFWVNNAGRCWWRSALTPKNSTATLSPIVQLAERA